MGTWREAVGKMQREQAVPWHRMAQISSKVQKGACSEKEMQLQKEALFNNLAIKPTRLMKLDPWIAWFAISEVTFVKSKSFSFSMQSLTLG